MRFGTESLSDGQRLVFRPPVLNLGLRLATWTVGQNGFRMDLFLKCPFFLIRLSFDPYPSRGKESDLPQPHSSQFLILSVLWLLKGHICPVLCPVLHTQTLSLSSSHFYTGIENNTAVRFVFHLIIMTFFWVLRMTGRTIEMKFLISYDLHFTWDTERSTFKKSR